MNEKDKKFVSGDMRPYEKFERFGPQHMTDAELLAVILRTGNRNEDALGVALHVLGDNSEGAGLRKLHLMTVKELCAVKGIGRIKAMQIKCIAEFCTRMAAQNAWDRLIFTDPATIANYYMEKLRYEQKEHVVVMMLDTKGHFLGDKTISTGTVKTSMLSPREVFLEVLKAGAVSFVLLHNHPSGDPSPSRDDTEITQTIANLGKQMDLQLLDHIIIGDNRYFSFKQQRYL